MTKKDYVKFAKLLEGKKPINNPLHGEIANSIAKSQWKQIVYSISDLFQMDDPGFDRDRFLRACGLE